MKTALVVFCLCWLVSPLNAQVAADSAQDDPLIFDKRLSAWTKLLDHESPQVRWTTARELGKIGPPAYATFPALLKALQDQDDSVRKYAGLAIPRIQPQAKDVPALIKELKADRGIHEGGSSVAEALGQIGPAAKGALPALKAQPGIWSAYAIAQIDPEDKTAIPYLVEMLNGFEERHISTQSALLHALGRIGPQAKPALPVLMKMLRDEGMFVPTRMEVAYAVARIEPDDDTALKLFLATLADPSNYDAASAASRIGFLGPEGKWAVPALNVALRGSDDNNLVREYTASALGEIGPDARDALPVLRDLLTHTNRRVREAAALAIYKIDRQ
jgi:HEAT repeat protein